MDAAQPTPPPRRKLRRALLALVVLALVAAFGWRAWARPLLELVLPIAARQLADVELELHVSSLTADQVELSGVVARGTGRSAALRELRARRLRLEFDAARLLRGDLDGLTALDAGRLVVEVDLDAAGAPEESPRSAPTLELPEHLPRLDLEVEHLDLALASGTALEMRDGALGLDEGQHLVVRGLGVRGQGWRSRALELEATRRADSLEELELRVEGQPLFTRSRVELARLGEGAIDLELRPGLGTEESLFYAQLDGRGARLDLRLADLELAVLEPRLPVALPGLPEGRLQLQGQAELTWDALAALSASASFEAVGLRLPGREPARLAGTLLVADGRLRSPELLLEQPSNRLTLRDLEGPLSAAPDTWLRDARGKLELDVSDLAAITGPLPLPERYESLPAHHLAWSASLAEGRFEVERGTLEASGGRIDLVRATLAAGAHWDSPLAVDLAGSCRIEHLDQLGLLVGRDDWWGRLEGEVGLTGTWPALQGEARLEGRNLRFGDADVGALALELEANSEGLELRRLAASGEGVELDARGRWLPGEARLEAVSLHLAVPELADWTESEALRGALELEGTLAGPLAELAGEARVQGSELSFAGVGVQTVRASLKGAGRSWRCEELRAQSDLGELSSTFACELREDLSLAALEFASLELARGGEGLSLERPWRLEVEGDAVRWDDLALQGEAGRLEGQAELDERGARLELRAEGLRPDVFLAGLDSVPLRLARLDGSITFEGPFEAPRLSSAGALRGLTLPGRTTRLAAEWEATSDARTLDLARLVLSDAAGSRVTASGSLPFAALREGQDAPLSLNLEARVDLEESLSGLDLADGPLRAGELHLAGELRGSLAAPRGAWTLHGSGLRGSPEQHPAELADGSLEAALVLADHGLEARALDLHLGEGLELELEARIEGATSLLAWRQDPGATLDAARIEAHTAIGALDLARLARDLEPSLPALEALRAGELAGELRLAGPVRRPELRGHLRVSEGTLRLGSGLPTAERVSATMLFEGESLALESLAGELGGAPFQVVGSVDFGDQAGPRLDLTLSGEDLLLYRTPEARVRADADLSVRGALAALEIAGSVDLTDGRYAPRAEFLNLSGAPSVRRARGFQLFELREEPLASARFDVALTSTQSFIVRNSVIAGAVRPELHLGGEGRLPVLTGRVYLDRTLLELPASSLELTGGTVLFDEDSPFLPTVDIHARSRMLGYDVRANITGAYDSPEVMLSSTPPLSQEDLLLLLFTGRLPEDADRGDALATANTVALYLAKDSLARWFADDGPMDEDSLFHRFDLATGRDVSKNGVETVDVSYRLTSMEGLSDEQRDRRHVYLVGERDRFEDYNYGLRIVFRLR